MLVLAMDSRDSGNDELGTRTEFFMGGLTFYGERASYGQGWKVSTTGHKQISFTSSSLSPHRLPKLISQAQISDLLALSTQSDLCWAFEKFCRDEKLRIYRCVILAFSETLPKFYPKLSNRTPIMEQVSVWWGWGYWA